MCVIERAEKSAIFAAHFLFCVRIVLKYLAFSGMYSVCIDN